VLHEQIIRSFDEDLIGFEPPVESLARLVRSADRHGELYAVFGPWGSGKTCFLGLLATAVENSATWINFDALRHQATEEVLTALVAHVAREAVRLGGGTDDQQVGNAQELYIIMMGIMLAETWPLLYHWFWVCSSRNWGEMMPELLGQGGGGRPSSATDQSQEFLRGVTDRLRTNQVNNMADLELVRRTVARYRLV
jgi:hypothetical protein